MICIYKQSEIFYERYGNGPVAMFAFPGYGEPCSSYKPMADSLAGEITFLAVDLPYHGKTKWREKGRIRPAQLMAVLQTIAREEKVENPGLAAFSFGGRVALSLFQFYPNHFSRLWLFAPDGLKKPRLQWFATHTTTGKFLFKKIVKNPAMLTGFASAAYRLKFINKFLFNFVRQNLDQQHRRERLYFVWTAFRNFIPDLTIVARHLNKGNGRAAIFFGKRDKIILPALAENLRKLAPQIPLYLIDDGHFIVNPRLAPVILEELNRP